MAFKRPESVLVVLYDQHHRVLLLQRDDDHEFWQSVTGTVEPHERPIETALREVHEETGLRVSASHLKDRQQINRYLIRKRWLYRYPSGTRYNTEHVFSLQVDSNHPLVLTEHISYRWVAKPEAIERLWSPSNRDAVSAFVPGPLS